METGELIWDEAKRLLGRQEGNLDGLRVRALGVLSAAGIVGAVFAAPGAANGSSPTWHRYLVLAAAGAFVLLAACSIYIQWPRKFDFSNSIDRWLEDLRTDGTLTPTDWYYNKSRDLNNFRAQNRTSIDRLATVLQVMCLLLAVQVAALVLAAV